MAQGLFSEVTNDLLRNDTQQTPYAKNPWCRNSVRGKENKLGEGLSRINVQFVELLVCYI